MVGKIGEHESLTVNMLSCHMPKARSQPARNYFQATRRCVAANEAELGGAADTFFSVDYSVHHIVPALLPTVSFVPLLRTMLFQVFEALLIPFIQVPSYQVSPEV